MCLYVFTLQKKKHNLLDVLHIKVLVSAVEDCFHSSCGYTKEANCEYANSEDAKP